MKENLNDTNDGEEAMIDDREAQKKFVHPYRKYQLWILALVILSIILGVNTFKLNSELDVILKTEHNLFLQVENIEEESKEIQRLYQRIEVNYKYIHELDKKKNIDILHDLNDLQLISDAIIGDKVGASVSYEVCYKASKDGGSPEAFLNECMGYSPLLFLIETTEGYRFAAYTSLFFDNSENEEYGYKYDEGAFIFSFDTGKKYKIEQPEYAISINKGSFPIFGKQDIVLGKDILSGPNSYANYPVSYEKDPKSPGDYLLNGGMKKFQVKEMEVLWPIIYDSN
jgi:hypothetical protein